MRKDQARIVQQCLKKDEPVFALRGQDTCAIPALEAYYLKCRQSGCSPEFLVDLRDIINEFKEYQKTEPTKKPD